MIQVQTRLNVADNSGAKKVQCIRVLGATRRRYAYIGDVIIVAIKDAIPNAGAKKGRGRAGGHRTDKKGIRPQRRHLYPFQRHAAVLINDTNEPRGTRIFGPVARELREKSSCASFHLHQRSFEHRRKALCHYV